MGEDSPEAGASRSSIPKLTEVACIMVAWHTLRMGLLTVLCLVFYLCLVRGLTLLPTLTALVPALEGRVTALDVEHWQRWLDPFQALR